ncbi:hypothetical protein DACRYDRAFT_110817 [Dacryopinax primogenitus]|uniref:Methyltransferase type 11 domain-containing protein n=1 Tax=Dacryopinax primogenitus (strain DJM 731) TaxID=1858805 RepID=M5FPA3_DACPD|nr:uncharacterized protein DACRYDRAFT_110817 [Dacryopinax primogenitus]EJT98375.1 hypothetical protein DACRYDRAFT_110817 [Dacryopinax primogenitus]
MAQVFKVHRPTCPATFPYSGETFTREDQTPDPEFYASPRFVHHIDDRCRLALQEYYAGVLPEPLPLSAENSSESKTRPRILDLCSSWTSHLPNSYAPPHTYVTGLGLSAPELAANPLLSRRVVHDLNVDPILPVEMTKLDVRTKAELESKDAPGHYEGTEAAYDAIICTVSVDYLVHPLEVFCELALVTREAGTAHMAFSDRCFPSKVIRRWLEVGPAERCEMVASYFWFAGTTGEKPCEPGVL